MESLAQSDFGGQSDDGPSLASTAQVLATSETARPAERTVTPPPEIDPGVERLNALFVRESGRLRQNTAGTPGVMTVAVTTSEGAELLVHFTQHEGGIDVTARCEPGDAPRLGALWPALQQALVPRKINLAPLRCTTASRSSVTSRGPQPSPPGRRQSGNDALSGQPGWETWM